MFFINLVFVDEKTSRNLNKKYRGLDEAATVLTFHYQEGEQAKFPSVGKQSDCLGEILICQSAAKKKNLSLKTLVNHGLKSFLSEISTAENLRTGP